MHRNEHGSVTISKERFDAMDKRIAELEAALRALVADCDDYARINSLSGTWATIETARETLALADLGAEPAVSAEALRRVADEARADIASGGVIDADPSDIP